MAGTSFTLVIVLRLPFLEGGEKLQEEVNERTISLCVQCTRMTAGVLKAVMRKSLNDLDRTRQRKIQIRQAEKRGQAEEKGKLKEQQRQKKKIPRGKQTIRNLMANGAQLTNILITDDNIKSFGRVARKYGIDYSLKRDNSVLPPKYMVFFRAKDVDVMTAAFKEYSGVVMNKSKKPSVKKKLQQTLGRLAKHRERVKTRQKDRGQER